MLRYNYYQRFQGSSGIEKMEDNRIRVLWWDVLDDEFKNVEAVCKILFPHISAMPLHYVSSFTIISKPILPGVFYFNLSCKLTNIQLEISWLASPPLFNNFLLLCRNVFLILEIRLSFSVELVLFCFSFLKHPVVNYLNTKNNARMAKKCLSLRGQYYYLAIISRRKEKPFYTH